MATKKDKREDILRGGLNALLGATPTSQDTVKREEILQSLPEDKSELLATIEDEQTKEELAKRWKQKRGRPRKSSAYRQKEAEIFTRTTWIMRREHLAKLKEISQIEAITIKDIMDFLVGDFIHKYEDKHGQVIPKEHTDASTLI